MQVLKDLEPKRVMHYFEEISGIQRGSSHEKPMSDYLVKFAKDRGFEVFQDELYNILIKAPGSAGGEKAEPVALHGHMDIVWKKDEGSKHDFFKDQLQLYIEDGYIHAKETTLGADNGIGVAYMLALLESTDIPHPPLEIILTVMEEMGKKGAAVYDTSKLTAKRMVDFNWVADEILAGCSGDVSLKIDFPTKKEPVPSGMTPMHLVIEGMVGGHCELDINLQRGNAIEQLARMIQNLRAEFDVRIATIRGGVQNNVIPSDAEAVIYVKSDDKSKVVEKVTKLNKMLQREFDVADKNVSLSISEAKSAPDKVFANAITDSLCKTILLIQNGVITMNMHVPGKHETSNNLGILVTEEDKIWMITTITGALTSRKHDAMERIMGLVEMAGNGSTIEMFGVDAPEFTYKPDSKMLAMAKKAYKEARGKEPVIEISNFSLQIGFFIEAVGVDTVGVGTVLFDIHSPRERMNIESVGQAWDFIKVLMRDLCKE